MARSVSFEVYYMQDGRWQIHARYEEPQREEAIEEAKRLDTGAFPAACVVREMFDSATNNSSESVIYHTPTMKTKPPVNFITSGAPDPKSAAAAKAGGGKGDAGKADGDKSGGGKSGGADARKAVQDAKKKRADKLSKKTKPAKPAKSKPKKSETPPPATSDGGGKSRGDGEEIDAAQLTVRIALAFLAACIVGTVVGVLAFYGLSGLSNVGVIFDRTINQVLLIGSWVMGWGSVFFPMLKRILNSARARARRGSASNSAAPTSPKRSASQALDSASKALAADAATSFQADKAAASAAVREKENETAARAQDQELDALAARLAQDLNPSGEAGADGQAEPPAREITEISHDDDPIEDSPAEEASAQEVGAQEVGAQELGNDNAPGAGEAGPAPDEEETEEEEAPTTGPEAVKAGLAAMVREAQTLFGKMLAQDSYLRFGLILFLAGAAETFARKAGVAQKQLVELLSIEIQNLGASKEHARGFAANIDEYLLDERYFSMYSAGRAGALRMSKGTNEKTGLKQAVDIWRIPPDAEQSAQGGAVAESKHYDSTPKKNGDADEPLGFVAVLFTDIVDSTNLQQTNGDGWMMNVVRAHNDICREAISRFSGREIKHTGDGIMASFPEVVGAADASLAMQDGFQRFSSMMPDLAFQVRVGLSAGEPIHESGDIFGTPVNLAARVMSKAGSEEIAVSGIVQEMCQGQPMKFQELGRFELKGFPEPQPIYRLMRSKKRAGAKKSAGL